MNIWPPPPKEQPPARPDHRPLSQPMLPLVFAAVGTASLFGFVTNLLFRWLPLGLYPIVGLTMAVTSPVLLIAGIVEGIRERRHWMGVIGLIWSLFALAFFVLAIIFPFFAKAREHA